jgi:hypothetical protein
MVLPFVSCIHMRLPQHTSYVGYILAEVDGFFQDVKVLSPRPLGGTKLWVLSLIIIRLVKELQP